MINEDSPTLKGDKIKIIMKPFIHHVYQYNKNVPLKRKLITLLLVLLGITLVALGFYALNKQVLKSQSKDVTLDFDFNLEDTNEASCSISSNIEYVYYSGSNPLWKENNKFGLYIYAEDKDFFEIAQNLVNSNGGDWGYVLIPYSVKDYDTGKWGRVFDQLISKHLIPVIQLWDVDVNNYKKETRKAAEFLNKFIWPVKYRYISVYNEPNDDKFWFESANPEQYAKVLDYTIEVFKGANSDFYIMNGALNVSLSSNSHGVEAFDFMRRMEKEVPGIFEKLDAWASHPYPQPNFSGGPNDTGRWSIRAYEDELKYLQDNLGVKKELPVFITETGWAHAEGANYNGSYLPVATISEYFKTAFNEVWLKDARVRAVMPFTIKYDAPFDHFSWVNEDKVPYLHYDVIKKMKKVEGKPPSLVTGSVNLQNCNN